MRARRVSLSNARFRAATPIVNENRFVAANYSLNSIVFEATTSKSLIVILATLMGGLIAVIFVLLRKALRRRTKITAISPPMSVAKITIKLLLVVASKTIEFKL